MQFPIIPTLVSISFILYALFKAWKLVLQILKNSRSQSWQPSVAEVLSKEVVKKASTRSGVSYYPEIAYRYKVMGQSYEKKIQLPKNYSSQKAQELLDSIGTSIAIRYDPNQPKDHLSEYETVNYSDILLIVIIIAAAVLLLIPYLG